MCMSTAAKLWGTCCAAGSCLCVVSAVPCLDVACKHSQEGGGRNEPEAANHPSMEQLLFFVGEGELHLGQEL